MRSTLLFFVLTVSFFFVNGQDYNIMDYGAIPDGKYLNTIHIQSAIDEAHENGGGRVVVPEGRFLTGSVILKSGVGLHINQNAILLGSTDPNHYSKINRWKALILADNQREISITGHGEIDGQGRNLALHIDSLFYIGQIDSIHYNLVEMRPKYYLRPQLIEFVECEYIVVRNVTLKNAACWVQTYDKSNNIIIDSVIVDSDAYWNNDGIDIQDCKNVRITNCYVNSADDGICLKSDSYRHICDSIYISDCTVRSSASAVKFGTNSVGGFTNVVIRNIKVFDTFRSAIAIESVDGGVLKNVLVENITARNTGNAIFIKLGNRKRIVSEGPGTLENIIIRNITVEVSFERPDYEYEIRGPALPFFHNTFPASITGIPEAYIENVTLENINILYPGRGNSGLANMPLARLKDVPEKEGAYPEFSMFGELPAWGFYIRHVRGLKMKNINLSVEQPDYRPPLIFDDVQNLEINSLSIKGESKSKQIVLRNSKNVKLDNESNVYKM